MSDSPAPTSAKSISRTERFSNLSTAHLTPAVHEVLNERGYAEWHHQLIYLAREYGYWMYVIPEHGFKPLKFGEAPHPESYWALPQCILDCFNVARKDGACWILFDRDEDPIEELPFYE